MKKTILALLTVLAATACTVPQISPETIQTAADTTTTVLPILSTVLKPAVETSKAMCDLAVVADNPDLGKAAMGCAQINDAWAQADAAAEELKSAAATGDQAKIDAKLAMLQEAVEELKYVLDTYRGDIL